jgi:hypothetical protein
MRKPLFLAPVLLLPVLLFGLISGFAGSAVASTAPTTIFGNATPAVSDAADVNAVELGVKFTASQAGTITGVRFYKSAKNTGTHVGSLWSSNGTLLAQATFTNESASGWQTVSFA